MPRFFVSKDLITDNVATITGKTNYDLVCPSDYIIQKMILYFICGKNTEKQKMYMQQEIS